MGGLGRRAEAAGLAVGGGARSRRAQGAGGGSALPRAPSEGPRAPGGLGREPGLLGPEQWDFRSQSVGEILLREQEVLSLCREQDIKGWFQGITSRGDRGLFPASSVQTVTNTFRTASIQIQSQDQRLLTLWLDKDNWHTFRDVVRFEFAPCPEPCSGAQKSKALWLSSHQHKVIERTKAKHKSLLMPINTFSCIIQ